MAMMVITIKDTTFIVLFLSIFIVYTIDIPLSIDLGVGVGEVVDKLQSR